MLGGVTRGGLFTALLEEGLARSAAASRSSKWSKNGGVMGKKRGVRAEIIAGSPDSASKSCKRSREEKKKKKPEM